MAEYKLEKVAFVSDNAGDNVWKINKVCWTAITTYQLWKAAVPLLPYSYRKNWPLASFEYSILVLPLLLGLTIFAQYPLRLNLFLYGCIGLIYVFGREERHSRPARPSSDMKIPTSPYPSNLETPVTLFSADEHDNTHFGEKATHSGPPNIPLPASLFHKPFVSVWRAHMMVMTVICILAVDFPVFPRSFGKCESWGTSLMDIGVGSFVFALGFVAVSPFLRKLRTQHPYTNIAGALRRSALVLLLGIIRLAMVKSAEYPEHVTEYGLHWNFFFTLGLLPLFGIAAERLWRRVSFRTLALLITAAHTLLLICTPLQTFALNDARPNLLAANKEGLTSFAGYLAIYLLGADTGMYTLPPDPYFAYRPRDKKTSLSPKLGKLMNVLFSYAVVWWTAFGAVHLYMPADFTVSRRLANTAYVLWIAAFNVSFLFLYLAVDQLPFFSKVWNQDAPAIFQAINKNGLITFLIANLLTGLVNVSLKTMYASDTTAVVVLVVYTAAIVASAWLLRGFRLKI